ncbi:MAG TPA: BCCT family transporter, partial [Candidatus Sphingobacterium stercorigallinarum]|nr:BCCT family transporter [Candidatus Sphingobacterium stercorigallinarum]
VTSADSGIFVMNSISTKSAKYSPKWQLVFWGTLLAVLALLLLNVGGLEALQTMTLITALPFSLIMVLFVVSLLKALVIDQTYYDQQFSVTTTSWSGEHWRERLKHLVSFKDSASVEKFIQETVRMGLEDLQAEFTLNQVDAVIHRYQDPVRFELEIPFDTVNNFVYGVRLQTRQVSAFMDSEENLPDVKAGEVYYPEAYFGDGREGYSVEYFTKNELISDVLKHYERFLDIVSQDQNEMFVSRNANKRFH